MSLLKTLNLTVEMSKDSEITAVTLSSKMLQKHYKQNKSFIEMRYTSLTEGHNHVVSLMLHYMNKSSPYSFSECDVMLFFQSQ